jgi:hypothetical protein
MPETVPTPHGAGAAELDAVSCTSATACAAVGKSASSAGAGSTELVEVRTAGGWKIETSPTPANSALTGVSCAAPTSCVAVGSAANHMLAEAWDVSSWMLESTPDPPGATASQLNTVSCSSPTACTAVGFVQDELGGFDNTLAARWDGTNWTIQNTPNAAQTQAGVSITSDQLNGVSCASETACTAVGSNSDTTLAERWDGSTWTIQSTPVPSDGSPAVLEGVNCASPDGCSSVGVTRDERNGGEIDHAVAEAWSGGTWSLQSTPSPTAKTLNRISCPSTTECVAVGSFTTSANVVEPLVEESS